MFGRTMKNTYKNLIRSPLFWLLFVTIIGLIVYWVMQVHTSSYYPQLGVSYDDLDPRWVYGYARYIVNTTQACYAHIFRYMMPIFTCFTTFSIVSRDYSDGFYEIERAGGVKSATYFFGRITALFIINAVILILFCMISFHLYTLTRGMVKNMTLTEYLIDSNIRLMRVIVVAGFPILLFYITLTYMIGSLFHSGIAAVIGSVGYAAGHMFLTLFFRFRLPEWFLRFVPPTPDCLELYLYNYDTREFEEFIAFFDTDFPKAAAAFGIMIGCSAVFMCIGYLQTRKRTQ